jgi:uncharacterized protein (TIGR02145 family)
MINKTIKLSLLQFSLILIYSCSSPNQVDEDNSSAQETSSSTNVTSGEDNSQTCNYSATNNTLACSEKTYKTVTIGQQVWMAENLNFGSYLVNDSSTSLYQNGTQKFCYDNDLLKCDSDGGLYQWHTTMGFIMECSDKSTDEYFYCNQQVKTKDHQGICPNGWHIPDSKEWGQLGAHLGEFFITSYEGAGKKMKATNTGFTNWDDSTKNDGNSSSFSGRPAGRLHENGGFGNYGQFAFFWSVYGDHWTLWEFSSDLSKSRSDKKSSQSIRCLKNFNI